MENNNKISGIIDLVKGKTEGLSTEEKELLRDELLAYLLFSEYTNSTNQHSSAQLQHGTLSEVERSLIRKLAEKTELLYKLMDKKFRSND